MSPLPERKDKNSLCAVILEGRFELIQHLHYSPDVAPSDYQLLPVKTKKELSGC